MNKKEFDLSEKRIKLNVDIKEDNDKKESIIYDERDVKEFIKRRESRLRNQIRIHWSWLKDKSQEEVAEWVVAIANAEAGEKLK